MFKQLLAALLAGIVFSAGLVLAGMTQPARVIAFLNIGGIFNPTDFGSWDASLAFVMGSALCVALLAFAITPRVMNKPLFAPAFQLPTQRDIDAPLIGGAALFGVGWGLAGYCPGPAFASLLTGGSDVAVFTASLVAGMWAARRITH